MTDLRFESKTSNARAAALRPTTLFCAAGALLACLACGSDSDDGNANYYLSGRVLDGATLEPIPNAELSLSVGKGTKTTKAKADGSFSVGPITPESDYRLSAKLAGFEDFAFYGTRLPQLERFVDRDHTVVGDVVLYQADQQSPAFTISAGSADARMPIDTTSAEARFLPVRLGTDPAERIANAETEDSARGEEEVALLPAGVAHSLENTWLPNHALSDVATYRAPIVDGKAAIPAGALRFGANYALQVYGGPEFEPLDDLFLASGRATDMSLWLKPSATALSTALQTDVSRYFTGRIYDGVSMGRLTDYSIRLEYFDRVISGTVDENGRYFVGPLLQDADFTIAVVAEGYRSFLSHNGKFDPTGEPSVSSLYFDAFLYPEQMSTPASVSHVRLSDSNELPSGTIRFAPTASSTLLKSTSGVGAQVWGNDEDLQQRAVTLPFTNGEVTLASGQLVFGVTYDVDIYGVPDHKIDTTTLATYTAGVDGAKSWTLAPLNDQGLAVISTSADDPLALQPNGDLVIRFNQPIALDPNMTAATAQRALNDGFDIDAEDDGDAEVTRTFETSDLTAPIAPGYKGVSFEINGDTLTLHWNRATGLFSTDADDEVLRANYGAGGYGLSLYAPGNVNPNPVDLDDLIGSKTVKLIAQ